MAENVESVRKAAARAATNPALWPETLWRIGQLVGSDMALIEHVDKARGTVEIGFTDRPDVIARTREAYEQHYWQVDPRWRAARRLPPGAIHHDDLVGDERTLDRFEYYVDLLKPHGLRYFIGSMVADDAEQTVILSLQRGPDRGRVGERERSAFAAILPDLRNAAALYLRLMKMPSGAALASALDRLADPLALLGRDGGLVFANGAMADLVAAGDVVKLCGRGLAGAQPGPAQALSLAISGALASSGSGAAAARWERLIVRAAQLAPDQAREFGAAPEPLICLVIDDPRRPKWTAEQQAMRLFGLTRQEASVGTHLADGLTTGEIACRLGVSRNTVRTHLARLREKLGVHSALAVAAEMRRAAGPFA